MKAAFQKIDPRLLAKYDLGFEICIYHPQMTDAIELVRRCPDVSFILDHIGKPADPDALCVTVLHWLQRSSSEVRLL